MMQIQRQTTVTLTMSDAEYDVLRRVLGIAAQSDSQAGALAMALGSLTSPPPASNPIRGHFHVDLPSVSDDTFVEDGLPREPPRPIDPATLPADDPRRVEAEALARRYGGAAPALVDTSPG